MYGFPGSPWEPEEGVITFTVGRGVTFFKKFKQANFLDEPANWI